MIVNRRRNELVSRITLVICVCVTLLGVVAFLAKRNSTTTAEVPVVDVSVAADDLTIWATVYTNSCGDADRLVIDESSNEVHASAIVRQTGGDCSDIGIPHRLSGRLAKVLGDRVLSPG
jgi:hypothetical protein